MILTPSTGQISLQVPHPSHSLLSILIMFPFFGVLTPGYLEGFAVYKGICDLFTGGFDDIAESLS